MDAGVAVVVVPLPMQGHLNQLLHLSHHIAARGIPVHYAGSGNHNRQARERIQGWDPSTAGDIHFHDLPLPPFPTPPPDPNATIKFPTHLQPLFDSIFDLQLPLASLYRSLIATHRRVVVIHDSAMSLVAQVPASIPNVSTFAFHGVSAFASLSYMLKSQGKQLFLKVHGRVLPGLTFDDCFTDQFLDFLRRQRHMRERETIDGHLHNTCHAIEGQFIDQLYQEPGWRDGKNFAIGPLNPVVLTQSRRYHQCLEWLDRQPPASVVYVSFGTMSSLSAEQIAELAAGIEGSGQRFIWVSRPADRGDIYVDGETNDPELPLGFETRVEGSGMVVRGWAPQLEILAHESTGGFLSHCGWNSCMESISMGVPLLAWPMHSDQPMNTVLVTEVLRVGISVRDWVRRHEVLPSAVIRDSIVRLLVDEEGKEIRNRAKVVGEAMRQAMSEGGTSKSVLDSFITYITRPL